MFGESDYLDHGLVLRTKLSIVFVALELCMDGFCKYLCAEVRLI